MAIFYQGRTVNTVIHWFTILLGLFLNQSLSLRYVF